MGRGISSTAVRTASYSVRAEHHALDDKFPEWGEGQYYTVELERLVTLRELLNQLYVLIPVLDAGKHYWVGQDEVEKLLRRGAGWLERHPEREAIVNRYLRFQKRLTREALERLVGEEEPCTRTKTICGTCTR